MHHTPQHASCVHENYVLYILCRSASASHTTTIVLRGLIEFMERSRDGQRRCQAIDIRSSSSSRRQGNRSGWQPIQHMSTRLLGRCHMAGAPATRVSPGDAGAPAAAYSMARRLGATDEKLARSLKTRADHLAAIKQQQQQQQQEQQQQTAILIATSTATTANSSDNSSNSSSDTNNHTSCSNHSNPRPRKQVPRAEWTR